MRPPSAFFLVVLVLVLAVAIARPTIHRASVRSELELASSDFCTCMLGSHTSDVAALLKGIREAYREADDDTWPMRCAPLAKRAMDAAELAGVPRGEGWKEDVPKALANAWPEKAIGLLERLQPFWAIESTIAKPRTPVFPAVDDHTPPLVDMEFREHATSVIADRVVVQAPHGTCTIDLEGATCAWEPESLEMLEHDPGAEVLGWKAGTSDLVRKDGATVVVRFAPNFAMRWGKTFADGRIVVVSSDGNVLEHANGRNHHDETTERALALPLGQRSTRFEKGWVLWKDTATVGEGDARVMVMNLADGTRGKPIALGTTKRPGWHSYDACEADALFVDMDPNILVLDGGQWSMLPMTASFHRIACASSHAFVTTGHTTERCDRTHCIPVSFDPFAPQGLGLVLGGRAPDMIVATDDRAFRIRDDGSVWMLDVAVLGAPTRTIALSNRNIARPDAIHLVRGHAIVVLQRVLDERLIVVTVSPNGLVRPLSMIQ